MQNQNTPKAAPRKKRLPQVFYDTGSELRRYVFAQEGISESKKETVRQLVARLAELSGVEHRESDGDTATGWPEECTLKEAARVFHFDMAEDDPRRAEWQRTFDALGEIADLASKYYFAKQSSAARPVTPPRRAQIVGDKWETFGFQDADIITAELCPEPQKGDIIILWEKGNPKGWTALGRFDYYDEEEEREYVIEEHDGEFYGYAVADFDAYKATRFERQVKRVASEKGKLRALRKRLARLERDDDITDCSAILRLEKQIFDLEHPVDVDDWSAWEERGEG